MCSTEEAQSVGLQVLQKILEDALREGADAVELEYVDQGLEVCRMFGNTGLGDVLTDRELNREIISAVVERAGLETRPRGKMHIDLLGEQRTVIVEEHESFGESSFRLILGKPRRGALRRTKLRRR